MAAGNDRSAAASIRLADVQAAALWRQRGVRLKIMAPPRGRQIRSECSRRGKAHIRFEYFAVWLARAARASKSGATKRAAAVIGLALPRSTLGNDLASVRSALARQIATVARPQCSMSYRGSAPGSLSYRDLSAASPIRLDRAREQSAHSCQIRFGNLGIRIADPSSIEIPLNQKAEPQSQIEKCPVRPFQG